MWHFHVSFSSNQSPRYLAEEVWTIDVLFIVSWRLCEQVMSLQKCIAFVFVDENWKPLFVAHVSMIEMACWSKLWPNSTVLQRTDIARSSAKSAERMGG